MPGWRPSSRVASLAMAWGSSKYPEITRARPALGTRSSTVAPGSRSSRRPASVGVTSRPTTPSPTSDMLAATFASLVRVLESVGSAGRRSLLLLDGALICPPRSQQDDEPGALIRAQWRHLVDNPAHVLLKLGGPEVTAGLGHLRIIGGSVTGQRGKSGRGHSHQRVTGGHFGTTPRPAPLRARSGTVSSGAPSSSPPRPKRRAI